MANQDRVNFIWADTALTTIPPIPVSEVAYRDTTQTPEQMEVGQQYDTIYNSARHNQLLFLLTSVAKTLCENGIMPFLAGQEYSQYARCIFTDGKLYTASRAILANEQPYPTPGDDSGVWIAEETSENLVPNSRRVIAGTGLTGGGPLSSDVTLSAKLDGKTTRAAADGAITAKDVAIGGDLRDLASARGQIGDSPRFFTGTIADFNDLVTTGNFWVGWDSSTLNAPPDGVNGYMMVSRPKNTANVCRQVIFRWGTANSNDWQIFTRESTSPNGVLVWSNWRWILTSGSLGDGFKFFKGRFSVPEYEGATASAAGTSGLVPPAAAGQQESFLTGGGEYKPALSTSGGTVTGSLSIKNTLDTIRTAPATEQELGLYNLDKNGNVMGGHDFVHSTGNLKVSQMYARNSNGLISSLGVYVSEDGMRYTLSSHDLVLTSDVRISRLFADNVRLIVFSGNISNAGYAMRYSPDTGELYLDGRAVHGKADTAGNADTATYANSARSALIAASAVQWVVNTSGPTITVPQGGTYNVVCVCFNNSGGTGAVKHYPNIAGGTVIPNAPTDYMVAGLCARVA